LVNSVDTGLDRTIHISEGAAMTITTTEYGNFQQTFDILNEELFGGK
jgi:hypothetical protein